jgi:DNA-binding NarL/FixJ family response regulator
MKKVNTDIVVMDISMPRLGGIETTREIKMTHPEVKIIILTMYRDADYFHHAISAGAEGFLLKEDADRELIDAIKTVREGKIYVSPILSHDLAENLAQAYQGKYEPFIDDGLTVREREVLKLVTEGKSNREIAELLFISPRTVEHHRSNIMKKLKINKNTDLSKEALRKGDTTLNK